MTCSRYRWRMNWGPRGSSCRSDLARGKNSGPYFGRRLAEMLFLAGLESMSREETVALLAQLNAITTSTALSEGLQRAALKAKDGTFSVLATALGLLSSSGSEGLRKLGGG